MITVSDPPKLINITASAKSSMALNITWTLLETGGHPPAIFIVTIDPHTSQGARVLSDDIFSSNAGEMFSLEVLDLRSSTEYEISVEAYNNVVGDNNTTEVLSVRTCGKYLNYYSTYIKQFITLKPNPLHF